MLCCHTIKHRSPPLLFWCWRWGGGMGPSIVGKTWPGMLSICGNPLELEAQVRNNSMTYQMPNAAFSK
jgi:hypothetical protein